MTHVVHAGSSRVSSTVDRGDIAQARVRTEGLSSTFRCVGCEASSEPSSALALTSTFSSASDLHHHNTHLVSALHYVLQVPDGCDARSEMNQFVQEHEKHIIDNFMIVSLLYN